MPGRTDRRFTFPWSDGVSPWPPPGTTAALPFPPVDIPEPSTRFPTVALRIGLPILVGLIFATPFLVRGGAATVVTSLVAIVLIAGLEIPVMLHIWARRRATLLASAPPGTVFASTARLVPVGAPKMGARLVPGALLIGQAGLAFSSPRVLGPTPRVVLWSQVAMLRVERAPNAPLAAKLSALLLSGERLSWLISGYKPVAEAMRQVRHAHEASGGGPVGWDAPGVVRPGDSASGPSERATGIEPA